MKSDVDDDFNKKYKVHLENYVDMDENSCVLDSHSILVKDSTDYMSNSN